MWRKLYQVYYYETFFYEVNLPIEKVIEQLDELFAIKGWLKPPNLQGEFVDYPESFIVTPKWSFISGNGYRRDQATLKGVLTKLNDSKTQIEISVRPHHIFGILSIFFVAGGLYLLCKGIIEEFPAEGILGSIAMTLFPAPILYAIARIVKGGLREAFEKYMNVGEAIPRHQY